RAVVRARLAVAVDLDAGVLLARRIVGRHDVNPLAGLELVLKVSARALVLCPLRRFRVEDIRRDAVGSRLRLRAVEAEGPFPLPEFALAQPVNVRRLPVLGVAL